MTCSHPYRKGSLLIPSGSCNHLHVICNDPVMYASLGGYAVLAVNITSINPALQYDQSCILKAGEHEFVKHDSYVYYRKADIFSTENIVSAVNDGHFVIHADFDEVTFGKILDGFEVSAEVSYKNKRFYEKYCKNIPE